jgi:hypothetical protein
MWEGLFWLLLFYFTQDKPILRSYFNCITCVILSTISIFYFPLIIFTIQWTFWYYAIDTFLLIYSNKFYVIKEIYLYHHIIAIVAIIDAICNGTLEFMEQNPIMVILLESSTIFLNFMLMSRESVLYKGWYPLWDHKTHKMVFGISFFIFRIIIGIPFIFYTIALAPVISQICLLLILFLNFWWSWKIVKTLFRKSKNM